MCHAALVQTDNVAVDQTVPAAADAYDLDAAVHGGTDNGTNGRIHIYTAFSQPMAVICAAVVFSSSAGRMQSGYRIFW